MASMTALRKPAEQPQALQVSPELEAELVQRREQAREALRTGNTISGEELVQKLRARNIAAKQRRERRRAG